MSGGEIAGGVPFDGMSVETNTGVGIDIAIAELARRQHGRVSLTQLRQLGLTASAVRSRKAAGRLHRVHRGVYAVGHELTTAKGDWMAAVLACGPRAALSHWSAAALHGLLASGTRVVDVTTPGQRGRKCRGIRAHASCTLDPRDLVRRDGIPATAVARTLLDIAGVRQERPLARAIDRAETLGVFDMREVLDVIARAGDHRAAGALLARAVGAHRPDYTRSELERRFLELCAHAGLPLPLVNVPLRADLVPDFMWPAQRSIVETDGVDGHGGHNARRRDHRRDAELTAAGWRVVRFTWEDVVDTPEQVVAILRDLLGVRAAA